MAIVSNAPWGSPAEPWRAEIARHGIARFAPTIVICRDAGWRKPAGPIFGLALERMRARPEECVFVGDEPAWDIAGAAGAGITPVLIDKTGKHAGRTDCRIIASLSELRDIMRSTLQV
jgi:putative hydrolase of the HAD superfamily